MYSTFTNLNKISKVTTDFLEEKNLKPVFVYEDLKDPIIKNKIRTDTIELTGVYLILNKITKDYYIGSASTGRIYTRFSRHLINLSGSKIVKLAVKEYGLDNFSFIVLELYPEKITVENNKKLLDLEDFYLKSLLPNYNILTEAGSSFGYKHTDLDRIKMKANYSESRRKMIGELNREKSLEEAIIEKTRQSALKYNYSEKALNNMKKKSKPLTVYNIENNTVHGEYNSIKDAALALNCNEKTIRRSFKTEKQILLKR
jgi:group I intron endonuclease